jgi:hypothetical protein
MLTRELVAEFVRRNLPDQPMHAAFEYSTSERYLTAWNADRLSGVQTHHLWMALNELCAETGKDVWALLQFRT